MNHTNPSFSDPSVTGWQLLGERKLSMDLDVETVLHGWLLEMLEPFDLHAEFFSKLVLSVQNAAMSLLKPGFDTPKFEHIHLLVFVWRRQTKGPHSWGFFRLEKLEDHINENGHSDHAVEFYLYQE